MPQNKKAAYNSKNYAAKIINYYLINEAILNYFAFFY